MTPYIEYSFDCEVELLGITSDVRSYFKYFVDFDVNVWYDGLHKLDPCTPEQYDDFCTRFCNESNKIYSNWYNTNEGLERAICTIHGIASFRYLIDDTIKALINDKIRIVLKESPSIASDQLITRLTDINELKEYIQVHKQACKLTNNWNNICNKAINIGAKNLQAGLDCEKDFIAKKLEEKKTKLLSRIIEIRELKPKFMSSKEKSKLKAKRKALIKSVNILEHIIGKPTTELFISGEYVSIKGQKFDFLVKKRYLDKVSYGGIDLTVCNKEGIKLIDLCWYVDKTPTPEQLAALALHVSHGNEDEIIQIGNIIHTHTSNISDYNKIVEIRHNRNIIYIDDDYDSDDSDIPNVIPCSNNIENDIWRITQTVQPVVKQFYIKHVPKLIGKIPLSSLLANPNCFTML